MWAEEGVELASHSLRSWEAAVDYFRVSPRGAAHAAVGGVPALGARRARPGRVLVGRSGGVLQGQPEERGRTSTRTRSSSGRRSGSGCTRGTGSRSRSRRCTSAPVPGMLPSLTLGEMARLVALIEAVAERSYELATRVPRCGAARCSSRSTKADRAPFLTLAAAVGEASWADVRICFERSPDLLAPIEPVGAQPLPGARGARRASAAAGTHTGCSPRARRRSPRCNKDSHHDLLSMAEELSAASPTAAMEFLKSSPEVLKRIRISELASWQRGRARSILEQSVEGGEAYFRLESGKGEEVLQQLSSRVELSRVGEVLRLYCKALTGTNVCDPAGVVPRGEGHRLGQRGPRRAPRARRSSCRSSSRSSSSATRTSPCTRCSRRTRRRTWSSAASSSASRAPARCCETRRARRRARAARVGRAAGARARPPHRHGALLRPVRRPPARVGPLRHRRGHAHRHARAARVRRHPPRVAAHAGERARGPPAAERAAAARRRSSRTWCARASTAPHTMIWPRAAAAGADATRSARCSRSRSKGATRRGHGRGDAARCTTSSTKVPNIPAEDSRVDGVGDDRAKSRCR